MKKRLLLIVILLSTSLTGFGEDGSSAGNQTAQPVNKKRERMIQAVAESEKFYNLAIDAYDLGDKIKARRYFRKAFNKLSSTHVDQNMFYGLSDYFDRIYLELNNRLNLSETPEASPSTLPPIPIQPDNPLVRKYVRAFSRDPMRRSIIRSFERMGLYKEMILKVLNEYNLPEELIYLPIVESRYTIHNVSSAGAAGLWQFMRHTGRAYGMRIDFWIDERKDPEKSTRAAARYLKKLYFWFNDWHLALAAYNRGEYGIARDLSFSKTTNFNHLAEHDAIPAETEKYVPQFMACAIIAQDPLLYGIEFELEKTLEYDIYETDVMIDLDVVAKCADTTRQEIQKLNPAIVAWCTPKNYPGFKLKIPKGTKDLFTHNLSQVKDLCPAREFIRYKVKKGDILGRIAQKYRTTVRAIKRDNNIKNERLLMPGKRLIIKPGKKYYAK